MTVSNKDKNSNEDNHTEIDPLDELNKIDEPTIETEKDPLDVIDQQGAEFIPEYDSKSGAIVKENSSYKASKLMEVIDKVDINNDNEESAEIVEPKVKDNTKSEDVKEVKSEVKDKNEDEKFDSNKSLSKNKSTKIIDDVKVDENGVPLLNQFNTDRIKKKVSLSGNFKFNKNSLLQTAICVLGVIIFLIGVIQSFTEVITVSDHVINGEHESFAMGLILLGILIMVLAFYNKIISFLGLNEIANFDSNDEMPKPKHEKKEK